MASDIPIEIEVRISDELKRLYAGAPVRDRTEHAQAGVAASPPQETAQPVARRDPAGWQSLRVRRDGDRPVVFDGLALMRQHCVVPTDDGPAGQTLALYLAQDRTVYVHLIFEPPETAADRPSHLCQPIQAPADLARVLAGWQTRHSLDRLHPQPPDPQLHTTADDPAGLSAFNFMAADCLNPAVLPAQGTLPCLP